MINSVESKDNSGVHEQKSFAVGRFRKKITSSKSDNDLVSVWEIERGPNKGLWAWKISAPQKRIQNEWNRVWGKRSGIACDAGKARQTAERQLRWHMKGAASSEQRRVA